MAQATLDDDELFGEAAAELREEIEAALDEAEATLPPATDIWEPAGDNLLGQLNTLRSALNAEEARSHLREAKKGLALGRRSEAFDDDDEIVDRVAALESDITALVDAKEAVGALTGVLPDLKQRLERD